MWYESLEKNIFIKNLYTTIPELSNVRIDAIKLIDEGRKVTLNFIMPIFADKPPAKWVGLGYNAVFVEVDFFDAQELCLKSNKNKFNGNINIEKNEEGKFNVNITGSFEMKLVADYGMIQSVSGYIDSTQ
ncbi:hypothetical protein C2W64_03890 [Brevibacillus laterosporus]|nr:Imm50 family immunity protein [Brevibacillus laterosporus]RAP20672.1 hypothetical protein C2W64_03890 [Brevibacillus laterosporus]